MPQDKRDIPTDDLRAAAIPAALPDDAGAGAALAEFAGDTGIPVVALVTVAEILTRIYAPAHSGERGESPPAPA